MERKQQIKLEDVSKKYDGRYVLKSINEVFYEGDSIAFMGHNGCGKSTLLRVIAGLTAESGGKISYAAPLHFSYVPEKFMPLKMSARDYLLKTGQIEGIKHNILEKRIKELGEDFFLDELLNISMSSMSKGTLQKIGVIQAILQRPDVLLLDEPLSGQDISSQKVFVRKINELRGKGTTIFMSCHEQSLVNAISEKVFTIVDGTLCSRQYKEEHTYTLLLQNPLNCPVWEGMLLYGDGYKLETSEEGLQKMIIGLLNAGWIMKGLYENDDEADKI